MNKETISEKLAEISGHIYRICGVLVLLALFASASAPKVYSVNYPNQADVKVFVVDYENQADLKIFFVEYSNQAGWRNKNKMHLMY